METIAACAASRAGRRQFLAAARGPAEPHAAGSYGCAIGTTRRRWSYLQDPIGSWRWSTCSNAGPRLPTSWTMGACLSNNAAERALRGIALGRKSWLFAGSDDGASYCPSDNLLINQADFAADREMTGVETCGFWRPAECLHVRYLSPEQAMARRGRLDELLPWNWQRIPESARQAA